MAKVKYIRRGIELIPPRSTSLEEMQWDDIEAAVDITFDQAAREEIHRCKREYEYEYWGIANGADKNVVRSIKEKLTASSRSIVDIVRGGVIEARTSDANFKAVSALCAACDETQGEYGLLYDALSKAEGANRELLNLLNSIELGNESIATQSPEVVGLNKYVQAVRKGCDETDGPSQNVWYRQTLRTRWGISVGPANSSFRKFSEALLNRSITKGQMEKAFAEADDRE